MSKEDLAAAIGEPLAHWEYSRVEWAAFAERQFQRTKREVAKPAIQASLAILFPLIGLLSLGPVFAVFAFLGVVATLICAVWFCTAPYRGRWKMHRASREVWIGKAGIFQVGEFTAWSGRGRRLARVRVENLGQEQLVFVIEAGKKKEEVRTLVPAGCDLQAQAVCGKLL